MRDPTTAEKKERNIDNHSESTYSNKNNKRHHEVDLKSKKQFTKGEVFSLTKYFAV